MLDCRILQTNKPERPAMQDKIYLEALEVPCIIGIFDWERRTRQKVRIDLEIPVDVRRAAHHDRIEDAVDYKKIAKRIIRFVSASRFHLIETLAERLTELLLQEFSLTEVRLRVSKPGAVRGSKNVGIEIVRKASRRKRRPKPGLAVK